METLRGPALPADLDQPIPRSGGRSRAASRERATENSRLSQPLKSWKGYAPARKDTGTVTPKGTSRIRAHEGLATISPSDRKPSWLKVRSPGGPNYLRLKRLMRSQALHTVCEEAGCPNIGECWESGTATFMILGDVCTRACKYCAVAHGLPTVLDRDEPRRVADTVAAMDLEHVVITSVNRDELPDGGQDATRRVLFRHGGETKTFLQVIQGRVAAQGREPATRADLRFGTGPEGQVFLLNKRDGVIRRLVP